MRFGKKTAADRVIHTFFPCIHRLSVIFTLVIHYFHCILSTTVDKIWEGFHVAII